MAVMLKDKFRYADVTPGTPASQTINSLLRNQFHVQDQLKCIQQLVRLKNSWKHYHNFSLHTSAFLPMLTSCTFLDICLFGKRRQFLTSASWEQFFIVTSVDIKIVLYYCEQMFGTVKEVTKNLETQCTELNHLTAGFEQRKMFEEESIKLMIKAITTRARANWKQHMPSGKIWRRRGSSVTVYQPSQYVTVVTQSIFAPIIGSMNCLSRDQGIDIVSKCVTAFVRTWMDHILNEQILFSRFGSQQLEFDFQCFVQWFEEQESFAFSLEEISEIHALPILAEMKNAIVLLACQPESRRRSKTDDSFTTNSSNSIIGSSISAISQVSIESFTGDQFDKFIRDIGVHNKDRWLSLRVKGGTSKRNFLCL